MPAKEDVEFLALLVSRGKLARDRAELVFAELQNGEHLDGLLIRELELSPAEVARLRRTRAGEIPEIPGFEVIEKIGSGGTSDVFRVLEQKTSRVIAMKVLREDQAARPGVLDAFRREAKLLKALDHPGLVKGLGLARFREQYLSLMEYVDGRTLLELLGERGPFGEQQALHIVLEVAEALAYLEQNQLIHGDVKPGNILLASDGRSKLFDLGFAAGLGEKGAQDSAMGTRFYIAPEKARGGSAADARSDIYSMGATLFHLVVGRLPFDSDDDYEVLRKHVEETLRSPELKTRGFSAYLPYFIDKMMAKDIGDRFQSWKELIDEIQAQLAGGESIDWEKDAREEHARRSEKGRRS